MKLYLLRQGEATGYDTYDSMVVSAESEEKAVGIHPYRDRPWFSGWPSSSNCWASSPDKVKASYIGEAVEGTAEGIILTSFNAG